jgi:hypothetical protein
MPVPIYAGGLTYNLTITEEPKLRVHAFLYPQDPGDDIAVTWGNAMPQAELGQLTH